MDELTFIIDSREKRPYNIPCSEVAKLATGDYSISGLEDVMAVERKSFDDLFGCLTSKLTRFKNQLKRLGQMKHSALVVDSTLSSILLGHILCRLPGELALSRLIGLCSRAGVTFYFVDSHGAEFTKALLAAWWKEEEACAYKEERKQDRKSRRSDEKQEQQATTPKG